MTLETTDLAVMGQMICETMLQLPAHDADAPARSDFGGSRGALTRISGAWAGLVAVDCSASLAARAASVMFDLPPAALSADDLRDAVLEVANVLGGNIKALLPEPCRLSVPSAIDGDVCRAFPDMRLVARVDVTPGGSYPMTVTVLRAARV